MLREPLGSLISAYDEPIVKAYCWGRFKILRQRFLDEIGQYLPPAGKVLDVGCGFGLFSLYYAKLHPDLTIHGIDLNPRRIEMARKAAAKLKLSNVTYSVGDVTSFAFDEPFDSAYMMDIVHHISAPAVEPLLRQLEACLNSSGRLLIKDVDTKPAYKRHFTYLLDKMMDFNAPVNYWPHTELVALIKSIGFEVFAHSMVDILPYPHFLFICNKLRADSHMAQ